MKHEYKIWAVDYNTLDRSFFFSAVDRNKQDRSFFCPLYGDLDVGIKWKDGQYYAECDADGEWVPIKATMELREGIDCFDLYVFGDHEDFCVELGKGWLANLRVIERLALYLAERRHPSEVVKQQTHEKQGLYGIKKQERCQVFKNAWAFVDLTQGSMKTSLSKRELFGFYAKALQSADGSWLNLWEIELLGRRSLEASDE